MTSGDTIEQMLDRFLAENPQHVVGVRTGDEFGLPGTMLDEEAVTAFVGWLRDEGEVGAETADAVLAAVADGRTSAARAMRTRYAQVMSDALRRSGVPVVPALVAEAAVDAAMMTTVVAEGLAGDGDIGDRVADQLTALSRRIVEEVRRGVRQVFRREEVR